jgi:hypothetical protein
VSSSPRRSSNKSLASTIAATKEDEIERKIALATEGFTTKFCGLVLRASEAKGLYLLLIS